MDKTKLNPHFQQLEVDYLYHLGLDTSMDLKKDFGDVQFVVFTRSFANADYFANQFSEAKFGLNGLKIKCKTIAKDERYHIYKVANTIVISHGVGFPSMLICLNEIVKLLHYAGVNEYKFMRLSPAGGLDVPNNSVVVANEALSYDLSSTWKNIEFGEYYTYSTVMNDSTAKALVAASPQIPTIVGKCLGTNSFYNGQARINGAIEVSFTKAERDAYLKKAHAAGVRAIDMESSCFMAFCNYFSIEGADVLAAVTDRLKDQDKEPSLELGEEQLSPALFNAGKVIINYILSQRK